MPHNKIKNAFLSAVNSVIANPDQFAVDPKKDFTRQRKITPDILISFLVSLLPGWRCWTFGSWIRKCHPFPH